MKQNVTIATIKQFNKTNFFEQYKPASDHGYMSQDNKYAWFVVLVTPLVLRIATIEFDSGRVGFAASKATYSQLRNASNAAKEWCESYNRRKREAATLEMVGA